MTEMVDFESFLSFFSYGFSPSGGRREEGRELLHLEAAQRTALGGGGIRGYFGCPSVSGTSTRA